MFEDDSVYVDYDIFGVGGLLCIVDKILEKIWDVVVFIVDIILIVMIKFGK